MKVTLSKHTPESKYAFKWHLAQAARVPWGEEQNLQQIHAIHSSAQSKGSPSLSVSGGDLPALFASQEANTSSKRHFSAELRAS